MKNRIAAAAALLMLGAALPATSALAYERRAPVEWMGAFGPADPFTTGTLRRVPAVPGAYCAPSSASEGNANQQARPVKQYGQTAGGSAC
ncbi:hypothetical protein [Methylobacterium sp. A54F]